MRILILSWEYPPDLAGGLGRHVAELAPALVQQGIRVDVITPISRPIFGQFPDQFEYDPADVTSRAVVTTEDDIVVHRVLVPHREKPLDIFNRATEVNDILEQYVSALYQYGQSWDLLHTHDWLTGFASIALHHSKNLPLITTIHATERGRGRGYIWNDLQRAIDQAEQNLIHQSNRIIVCSHYMDFELRTFFQVPAEKMSVVPNGVDIKTLHVQNEDPQEFRAKFADPDQQIVFTVSRLVHEKGVHRLVEATPRILAECPHACIIIAGRGPEADNLKRQAEYLNVADHINFMGFVSDEDRNLLFKVANCAIFPSLYEPFGIVALEAMALGCPVIVSEVGGLAEIVVHEKTGITVYPDDANSVAWGVVRALHHPRNALDYAIKARQQVEELFNWPRIAGLTKDIYEAVITETAGASV
ncbi:MAG: glycosyltransferase family 4 protein [Anaerolineae bacterium]|nr:glycosyltransferase family 4 protein [Anaerolineae bacterium]